MSDIIQFKNINSSTDIKDKLIDEFNLFENILEEFKLKYPETMDEKMKQLLTIFKKVKIKVDNKKFLTSNQSELFLNSYKNICEEEDEFLKCYTLLEYINLIDMFKNQILLRNNDFIKNLIIGLATYEDMSLNDYKRVLPVLLNKKLEELLKNKSNDISEKDKIIYYIEKILQGYNILDIIADEKSNKEINEDSLEVGIITIDRIFDYYINCVETLNQMLDCNLAFTSYIYKIKLIKTFNNNEQLKFITIIKELLTFKYSVYDQLKFISILVDIFLNLKEDGIENYSTDDIISMVFVSNIKNTQDEANIKQI